MAALLSRRPLRFRPALHALDDRITPAVSFAYPAALAETGALPEAMASGDLNGDGRLDLVSASVGAGVAGNFGSFSVTLNNTPAGATTAAFFAPLLITTPQYGNPKALAVADLNGDGRSDVVVLNADSAASSVSLFMNTAAAGSLDVSFADAGQFAVNASPSSLAVADVNGDGRPDLVTGSGSRTVVRLNTTNPGDATPSFATAATFVGGTSGGVTVGDFNGDGRPDLVAANAGKITVRLNTTAVGGGTPTFTDAQIVASAVPCAPIQMADFTGDGRLDLVVFQFTSTRSASYTYSFNTLVLLTNTTADGASAASFAANGQNVNFDQPAAASRISLAVAADFNSDGVADIATASYGAAASLTVYTTALAAGGPTFAAKPFSSPAAFPLQALAAGDWTGDGRPDLAIATQTRTDVFVLSNDTPDTALTTPSPLVARFGTDGVWANDQTTGNWWQLTVANPNALAVAANGNVVGAFGNDGVWYYRPLSGWTRINGNAAMAVAIDGLGNATASFAGFGTASYRVATGNWTVTTDAVADSLFSNANGDIVGYFVGHGVYQYRPSVGWASTPLTTVRPNALAIAANGDMVASFADYGVYVYRAASGWRLLNGYAATALAVDGRGIVTASFAGFGVARYLPSADWWQPITSNDAAVSIATDLFGNVFASFDGAGVWRYGLATGWAQRRTSDGMLWVG